MKKSVLLLLVLLCATISAEAQREFILSCQDKKGFVNLSAGVSIPVAQFANSSSGNSEASMASPGTSINLSVGYRLLGNWGLMIKGEQLKNFYNTKAMLAAVSPVRAESDVWTAKADNWIVNSVMVGPFVSLPYRRFALDARLLAGLVQATLPGTSMEGNYGYNRYAIQTFGATSKGLALGGGVTVRYRLSPYLSITLAGDLTRSQLVFHDLRSMASSSAGRSESVAYNSERVISAISVSTGMSFLFGNSFRPY
ncbi:outer membrane beta-barrel protein [Spirosoma sp. KUDC1026]|uniref:outer membrane beta-barrel protein n=1 Tax=Spirosoma sp. KUDC1026 TaxID=2745947 RepID=UPI00159BD4A4|nr:outer membrane beta-barrel protein [Spirosoma sp. KUDC1026]QKZ12021.1 hypothetical protein HU175_05010 [Spirosoma sp. KUDC1026]